MEWILRNEGDTAYAPPKGDAYVMKLVITMRNVLRNKKYHRGILFFTISSALAASALVAAPSQAVPISSPTTASADVLTMLEYKVEYAAWLAASKAWNVTRAEQVATHIAERVVYAKALASDHVARVAIVAARTTALADARQTYLDAAATSTNPALRAKWLSVRTAAYAAIIASAEVQLAALPVLGPKPVWPVAAPRPVKPLKQVITL